jgi:energy-coupling factor transporter ATP-binding protein EcfA2
MASYQYVYHMDGVTKAYGSKKVFENIRLSFLPGVKIGVVGVNGSGKSTLMRIMAGQDKDFQGEAWAAKGAKVGYLPQEPALDETKDVRGNVMEGVAAKQALVTRFNEVAMKVAEDYSDELMEEMTSLQDQIPASRTRSTRKTCGIWMPRSTSPWRRCAARLTAPTSRPSRVAKNAASRCASCCSKPPRCCCWTSPPTIWTPRPSCGCKST